MKLKSLPREVKTEGLTLDFVNSVNMKVKYSPVLFQKGDEPAKTMLCGDGFWVIDPDGDYVRDGKGNLITFDEKTCLIARARYLFHYQEQEKEQAVQNMLALWNSQVAEKMQKLEDDIKATELVLNSEMGNVVMNQLNANWKTATSLKLEQLKSAYNQAKILFDANRITELLEAFGICSFSNPMLTIQKDNAADMALAKNVVGREAIEKWDGNIATMYARIEVEKRYRLTVSA